MSESRPGRARRWGRRLRLQDRLTAAFILVALGTGAILVVTTFVLVRVYRTSTFESRSQNEARLALLSAPEDLDRERFESLLLQLQERGAVDGLAVIRGDGQAFGSLLDEEDVPDALIDSSSDQDLVTADERVDGETYYVVVGTSGSDRYAFAFSRAELDESVNQTRNLLLIGWAVAAAAAALLGRRLAARTLAPVRRAAEASQALAEGVLDTRLAPSTDDEFARLAESFNEMAEALAGKIDELSRAAARERRFTADVAHELRTPLTGMAAVSSIVEPRVAELPDDLRRPVELLVEDVARLRELVVDLLELARHDAGQETVDLEPLALSDAVEAVVRSPAVGGGVALDVDPTIEVLADRRRFARVLGNLVANAIAHGEGQVEVRGHRDGAWARIDVLDRGAGFGPVDPLLVFDRFYKGDVSRSDGGSGLGLSIALENARLQGGTLEAAPRDGGGARFSFRLPMAAGDGRDEGGPRP